MFIDILVIIMVGMALVKGYTRGLIMAIFNTVSLILGLAAAVKLSALVSSELYEKWDISPSWAPLIAFALVFLGVAIVIRMAGKAFEKTLETVKIGFTNRLGGMVMYLIIYLAIASVLVYYLEKVGVIDEALKEQSVTYTWIAPWGPAIMDTIGVVIPWFKDMFGDLNDFFDKVVSGVKPGN